MRYTVFLFALCGIAVYCATSAFAQNLKHESKGRKLVEAAYAFQSKLLDSSVTVDQVIHRWSVTAANPAVRKDPDAQAIAYGCEGLLEIQKGEAEKADSLLKKALPLFRLRESKAPILVSYAEFQRQIHHYYDAMRADEEIVKTMDSIPELDEIPFYHQSGYAAYAYAIDASFAMAKIAMADTAERTKAVELLRNTLHRHPADALGLMDMVALHKLHALSDAEYQNKVAELCAAKPDLQPVSNLFEEKFLSMKK